MRRIPRLISNRLTRCQKASRWDHRKNRHFQTPKDVQYAYEHEMVGAVGCEEADDWFADEIKAQGGWAEGDAAAHSAGIADTGKGELCVPFLEVLNRLFPDGVHPLPGAAQQRGDCVSHSQKNAGMVTIFGEVALGHVDEESGQVEGLPTISPKGLKQGFFSSEAIYWWRGYNGDGWHCGHAAKVTCEESGMWPRQPYDQFGFDLTTYSGRNAGLYGSREPSTKIKEFGLKHRIRTATRLRGFEQVRDFCKNLYGISSCGGEGFSKSRDENGFSKRTTRWAHAMAIIGFDDRESTIALYGDRLVLIQNSWGQWNKGGRKVLGTDYMIPHGAFWARWSDVQNRSYFAMSGAMGWPPQVLESLGGGGWG